MTKKTRYPATWKGAIRRSRKTLYDQTEAGLGVDYLFRNPMPFQRLVEELVTNGIGYTDCHRSYELGKLPSLSYRLSEYLAFKRALQKDPTWTDERFEKNYREPEPRTIGEYQLQNHLLEMELLTADKDGKAKLKNIQQKIEEFTHVPTRTETYESLDKLDHCIYHSTLAAYEFEEMLNNSTKDEANRVFKVVEGSKDVYEAVKKMGWRFRSRHLQGK